MITAITFYLWTFVRDINLILIIAIFSQLSAIVIDLSIVILLVKKCFK